MTRMKDFTLLSPFNIVLHDADEEQISESIFQLGLHWGGEALF
ncbi:hypothetical protein [Neobacillus endophyticus]|nr:hypothetical protein [Neobacillus endophyticus]